MFVNCGNKTVPVERQNLDGSGLPVRMPRETCGAVSLKGADQVTVKIWLAFPCFIGEVKTLHGNSLLGGI